jgi:transposase
MEACGTSHHWARELIRLGHDVRLMPPAYVKPYVKRGKTDASDAQAICEAVTRPTMRFVAVKSAEQQAALSLHRTRDLLVRQRTQLVNMIRGLLAEFGIVLPDGVERALGLARQIHAKEAVPDVPAAAQDVLNLLCGQVLDTHARVQALDRSLLTLHRTNDVARRLASIPGIGPVGATALAASVADPRQFRSGREFAAWLGLTPLQNSSGGKERLGRITKMGATAICVSCLLSAPPRWSGTRGTSRRWRTHAFWLCWPASRCGLQAWRWRTKWRVLSGPSWLAGRRTRPVMCRCWQDESESIIDRAGMIDSITL